VTLSRRAFVAGAATLLARPAWTAAGVRVGLERVADEASPWRGVRVALLAHDASRVRDGRFAAEVLAGAGAHVVRVLAPEHGVRGRLQAGERVPDETLGAVPVVSLYGRDGRVPLDGVDRLVVDLQDAGVRFYTYAATMLDAIAGARAQGVDAFVLDRPNPLGGEVVEGPEADGDAKGIFARVPGPLVHGLTMGEIARLVHGDAVRVVPLAGWSRSTRLVDTGLPFVPPSPNLRSAEAMLAYPGTALLEATNVSEGRGTGAPFLTIGAPWLPADLSLPLTPGYAAAPTSFVPSGPGARFPGERCQGLALRVTDPALARPYALGVTLLHALRRLPGFAWRDDGRALDALVATRRLREALAAGRTPAEILAADATHHVSWRERRRPSLLY
jgi:uncharacterized protein YbbC (DUF1343 family)